MNTAKRKTWALDGDASTAGEVRLFVFRRDRTCMAHQFDPLHVCKDKWGRVHDPFDWSKMTLEHVPSVHSPSDVRRDDPEHCVTLCHGSNVGIPSKELRAFCRAELRKRYPTCRH